MDPLNISWACAIFCNNISSYPHEFWQPPTVGKKEKRVPEDQDFSFFLRRTMPAVDFLSSCFPFCTAFVLVFFSWQLYGNFFAPLSLVTFTTIYPTDGAGLFWSLPCSHILALSCAHENIYLRPGIEHTIKRFFQANWFQLLRVSVRDQSAESAQMIGALPDPKDLDSGILHLDLRRRLLRCAISQIIGVELIGSDGYSRCSVIDRGELLWKMLEVGSWNSWVSLCFCWTTSRFQHRLIGLS